MALFADLLCLLTLLTIAIPVYGVNEVAVCAIDALYVWGNLRIIERGGVFYFNISRTSGRRLVQARVLCDVNLEYVGTESDEAMRCTGKPDVYGMIWEIRNRRSEYIEDRMEWTQIYGEGMVK